MERCSPARFVSHSGDVLEVSVTSENGLIALKRRRSDRYVAFPDSGSFTVVHIGQTLTE